MDLGRHRLGDFGRRRHRRRRRGLHGLGDPAFGEDLRDVAIGVGGAAVGLGAWTLLFERFIPTPVAKVAVGGLAGVLAGTLVSPASKPLGIGMGAAMGGAAIIGGIMMATAQAGAPAPVSAYTYSRRYGMHGLGQRDPYAYAIHGLGRTRVTELAPPGYQVNGLNAYMYSRRYGMHGLGVMPSRIFSNPLRMRG